MDVFRGRRAQADRLQPLSGLLFSFHRKGAPTPITVALSLAWPGVGPFALLRTAAGLPVCLFMHFPGLGSSLVPFSLLLFVTGLAGRPERATGGSATDDTQGDLS